MKVPINLTLKYLEEASGVLRGLSPGQLFGREQNGTEREEGVIPCSSNSFLTNGNGTRSSNLEELRT